jgi:hypothetical protein
MDGKQYRYKLLKTGNPDQYDKWFDAFGYCIHGKGECKYCPAYLSSPNTPLQDSRCGKGSMFEGRNPFCTAFKTCEECGIQCENLPDFAWVQTMLDKCEEAGLFECPGVDRCWKGADCGDCNYLPCRNCVGYRVREAHCSRGYYQIAWDCSHAEAS